MEQTRGSIIDRVKRLHSLLCSSLLDSKSEIIPGSISRETLLDSLLLLYDECNNEFLMKDPLIADFIEKYRSSMLKIRDLYINLGDFETIKVISKGRFAEVSVVRDRENSNVYAIKKLRKSDVLNAYESICFENERNVLLTARKHEKASKWIPELIYSFQNMKYIYYVMEYCPGGNLSTMLEYYKNDPKKDVPKNFKENVPEHMLKFYIPEIVEAIHTVHSIGFAHRDVRPDNFVFDKLGHLKLIDFGSSAKLSKNGVINAKLMMNIPHYTAPEIFKFLEKTGKPYDYQCDWWSLGVVLFELIEGHVPFTSEEVPKLYLSTTYSRKVQFPKDISISHGLKFIIQNLLQPVGKRLDYKKITSLDYFDGVDWTNLKNRDPPFVPSLMSLDDTSYFNTFENQRPTPKVEDFKLQRRFTGRNLPFLGFTFLGDFEKSEPESDTKLVSSSTTAEHRQTEHFKKIVENSRTSSSSRHSVHAARSSEVASECSNDSFQSAASDVYSCLTEEQQKLLQEKEELSVSLIKLQREHEFVMGELVKRTKELQDSKKVHETQIQKINEINEQSKKNYEEQINKFKKMDRMKKDVINKLNVELEEKVKTLQDLEEKLQNVSNKQAAKMALLNRTKTNLRSRSVERDQYEQENATLKNQLNEANKKIIQLTVDLEKKNKVRLDLELKMLSNDKNGTRQFSAEPNNELVKNTEDDIIKQFEKTLKEVLKENCVNKEKHAATDIENLIQTIHQRINELSSKNLAIQKSRDQITIEESTVVPVFKSQIERLEAQLIKEEQLVINYREKESQLMNEIFQLQKELSDLKVELHAMKMHSRTLEDQLKSVQIEKDNSQELVKQLENTIKCVLKESLGSKENKNSADIESMFNQVQRRLSILSERQVVSHAKKKSQCSESNSVQVLEAQIERLEEQMEKAREKAILQREEANAARSKLTMTEKQLSDMKIDLRIAQRETKEAQEEIKELKEKLKKQCSVLNAELSANYEKLKTCEKEVEKLIETLENKNNELQVLEASVEDKTSVIHSLGKEIQSMKSKIENLTSEKKDIEARFKKRDDEIEKLNGKLEILEMQAKIYTENINKLEQKESEWKSECSKLKFELESLRETCELQDRLNVAFETKQHKLEEDIRRNEDEKLKLQEKLDNIQEEHRLTRKMLNEEKSLNSVANDEIKSLKEELEKRDMEMKDLIEEKEAKTKEIDYLEEKVHQFEDCIFQTHDSVERSNQCLEMIRKENCTLKEERTNLLTRMHRLKEEKVSLQQELNDAIEEINGLQQIYSESQLVLDQVKAYYEDRHMKDTTTLQQYSKLNEFLQTKVDGRKQKRTLADKLFGLRGKENSNPKEIENLLYSERKKNKELAEQLYQTRTEMMILKSSENISKCSSPKKSSLNETYSKKEVYRNRKGIKTSESGSTEIGAPLHARLGHNIPHKFDSKLCKKVGVKCAVCRQTINLGHMSQCKECHIRCHVVCSTNMAPSCGLSKALMNQIPIIAKKNPSSSVLSLGSTVQSEFEGSLRVLENKNWINMHLVVDSKGMSLFEKSGTRKVATERIEFKFIIAVDGEPYLENVSGAEKHRVIKISYLTDNKQPNTLVLLPSSEDEKISWMNILKRNLPETLKQISFEDQIEVHTKGSLLMQCDKSNDFDVLEMISLSSELALMATDRGLFSLKLNVTSEKNNSFFPSKISGIDKVSKIKISTKSRLAFFICGDNNFVKQCDLRMLVSNAEAAQCSSPKINITDVSSVAPIERCKLFAISTCSSFLAVATNDYIMIIDRTFGEVKFEDNVAGIVDIVFTHRSLIFCTGKDVCEVNLTSFQKKKLNLFKRITGENEDLITMKGIVKINNDSFLVCNQMFGTFVDADGKRNRHKECIKWHLPPRKIVYNRPFLCLSHDSSISLVYLPSSNEDCDKKYKFSMINYHQPSILGIIKEPMDEVKAEDPVRGIFIKEQVSDNKYQVFFLDPLAFIRRNPKESWSSIDTQLTGETTDEECIRKSLNISNETDISLNSSILGDSSFNL